MGSLGASPLPAPQRRPAHFRAFFVVLTAGLLLERLAGAGLAGALGEALGDFGLAAGAATFGGALGLGFGLFFEGVESVYTSGALRFLKDALGVSTSISSASRRGLLG